MILGWGLLLGCLGLSSCGDAETTLPPELDHTDRAQQLRQQVHHGETQLGSWQPWFDFLQRNQDLDRCPESWRQGGPTAGVADGVCMRRRSQHLMWDSKVSASLADPSALDDVQKCCGPLQTIVHFQRQLQTLDIDLLVMFVPPVTAVYPERLGFPTPLGPGETPPLLDWRLRRFFAALEDAGVEVCDVLPAFLAQRDAGEVLPGQARPDRSGEPRELLYLRQDTHWTPFGAAVAAQELARRVRRYPWFDEVAEERGTAIVEESFAIEHRRGSIVRRFQSRQKLPRNLPKEPVRRRQARIRGEIWSLNDRTSPILLLGDSFSAAEYDLADQLLKHLGFRVDRVTVTGGLPSGGLKALRFRDDQLAGKRLVIWEITSFALTHPQVWQPVDVLTTPSDGLD